jgi:hypothetical protein
MQEKESKCKDGIKERKNGNEEDIKEIHASLCTYKKITDFVT